MPEEKNTKRIREVFGLTQKELSELTMIPLGTIRNWDSRDCMPEYMGRLLFKVLAVMLEEEE